MKKYLVLFVCAILGVALSSCESTTTTPPVVIKTDTTHFILHDTTLFMLSEGGYGNNNAELDEYAIELWDTTIVSGKDSSVRVVEDSIFNQNIYNPLGDVGNDIQIFGKRIYLVLENSNKILSINPDSLSDRISIQFPAGTTPYNMAQVSANEVWVSEFTSKQIYVMNPLTNSLGSPIPIDTGLAYISVYKGKAFMLTNANKLEVMDIASKNILSNKYIGDYPAEIAIDTAHNSLLVLVYGDAFVAKTPGKILWVDPKTYAVTDSIILASTAFINQIIVAGAQAFLTYGDHLGILDLATHKISSFASTAYYKGIYDAMTNELILGRGTYSAPGYVDILDATTGTVKKTFPSGILPGHFVLYRKQ